MAFSATKRELGELYTFFRLLADGAVSPGTPKAEKDETLRWPVALIQREEHDGTRRYYIEAQEVRVVSGTTGKDGSLFRARRRNCVSPAKTLVMRQSWFCIC
jgi:hypothetical protein